MKEKIKKFLGKSSSKDSNAEIKQLTLEEEVKFLRKENEELKKSSMEQGQKKFLTRRSIRKFSEKDIDFKTIFDIVECGLNAPCAGNVQNSKIIIVENKNKKIECGKIAMQQYWLSTAPYLLVVTRDDLELTQLYPNRGELYSIQNTAALIENVLLAAHFHGLGACWVEAGDNEILKEMLNIPVELKVDAIIPIGYALENPQVKKIPTMNMIFFDKFNKKFK